ncbi:HIRA-interacting protein 3 [Oryzias melastigma]|uniref:HIRA interacting protein 3 n=1 Tax=Oryzias melastigma TaxID=30732 RepID=A0A3B3CAA3_ORYME|nr:HIRA-interacting protein 3 [Oryzias melastigma]
MSSEKERAGIRKFVRRQLRDEPDLSKLTLGLLKKQYLVHVGRESLSPEAKAVMKQVVEEELANMQDSEDDESDCEVEEPHIKRKREKQQEEEESEEENESRAKKRRSASSASESEDKTGSEDERQSKSSSEGENHEVKKSDPKRNPECKEEPVRDDSSDDEMNESKSKSNESVCSSPEQKLKIKANAKNGEIKNANGGKKTSESDAESSSEKSDASNGRVSSKNKGKVLENKRDNGSDSDSSSPPSLEEEKDHEKKTKDEKKKTIKRDETSRSQKPDSEKAIVRLKRYISLCGVRKNYKKMLEGCKSIKAKVAVLKKELEDLGVQGNPSIEKCKKIRMKREEAQEVAELDVGNIITTQGRPKRRGISARMESNGSPSSAYQRTLNSSSGSDRENQTSRERKKISEWTNLRGIISDDGDSS